MTNGSKIVILRATHLLMQREIPFNVQWLNLSVVSQDLSRLLVALGLLQGGGRAPPLLCLRGGCGHMILGSGVPLDKV